jgi:REP element-mobilizing transposase RayT
MKGPGSQSLRKGRKSTPWASYLITKNTQENSPVDLTQGENPQYIINWFLTAQRKAWFDLSAFVVMPNHYHLVILLGKELSLSEAIGEINENSARLILHPHEPRQRGVCRKAGGLAVLFGSPEV